MPTSDIAHYAGLELWGPYDLGLVQPMLKRLVVDAGELVLDVGCGDGALLERAAALGAREVVGIDRSAAALASAKARFHASGFSDHATWMQADAADLSEGPAPATAIVWLGGPYVGTTAAATLAAFHAWLPPGGHLLFGVGHWRQPPPEAYLEATGIEADEMTEADGVEAMVAAAGFHLLERLESPVAAWDRFEDAILANREDLEAGSPDDSELSAALERARAWHDAYRLWGRDTLGFSLGLASRH